MVVETTAPTSAVVAVVPPAGTSASDYDEFVLETCRNTTAPPGCPTTRCPPANATACTITGLSPGLTYTVTATAVKGGATSMVGEAASFTTPHP